MIVKQIFEHARERPEKIAILYGPRNISYGEFASWISQAREFLAQQDLRRGSVAVLAVECLVDCWVLALASQSLGLITIAVDAQESLNDLQLRNIGCIIAASRQRLLQIAPQVANVKRIEIPEYFYLRKPAEDVAELPDSGFAGGHIALTSGSTGVRKKVLMDDNCIEAMIRRRVQMYGLSERSIANVFNFGLWTGSGYKNPLAVWDVGGSVVIHQFPERQESLLVEGLTHAFATTRSLEQLLQASDIRRNENMKFYVGGSTMPRSLIAAARARLTPHVFVRIGSREAGAWGFTCIERDEDVGLHRIHPSVELQIVDDEDRPLPAGKTGVIRIRTPEMVTSYLDDEEASRAVFRHGYFYPGDLGALQPDGRLVLKGRVNNVINLKGDKVAAEQIEAALEESLAVSSVCVLPLRNGGSEEEFHVVIESRTPIENMKLAPSIRAQLPGVPYARVRFVDSIPRTDTGKIDRAALRQQVLAERSAK